jgi:hypothetical protein|tara:strand:- start:1647 stop:2042 length:396 start_codon:yes stop_codon:yes gene_type:complete
MGKIKPVWTQVTGQATAVKNDSTGANLKTVSITVPHRGLIRRVRVRDDGTGTGTPTVAARISDASADSSGLSTTLAYGLTTNPIDSEEEIFYEVTESSTASRVGTIYVDVWTNNSTADHVIDVKLDIENLA